MACVALPTCGLALAESERFLPELITALEESLDKAGLRDDEIVIRMTGCPNGCARPYLAEIGLVGRSPGFTTSTSARRSTARGSTSSTPRTSTRRASSALLEPMLARYAKEREDGEHFGDFVIRAGYVRADDGGQPLPRRPRPREDRQLTSRISALAAGSAVSPRLVAEGLMSE